MCCLLLSHHGPHSGQSPGGGGGYSQYILVGAHTHWVLGTGAAPKWREDLRHGHEPKKEGVKNWSCKKRIFCNLSCTKCFILGAYLLITFTFDLST